MIFAAMVSLKVSRILDKVELLKLNEDILYYFYDFITLFIFELLIYSVITVLHCNFLWI